MSYDWIGGLGPDSTAAERESALATLIEASPVDQERELKRAAKKLDVTVNTVSAEFKLIKERVKAKNAREEVSKDAGEDWDKVPDLDACIEQGKTLIPCCVAAHLDCNRYTLDDVAQKAEQAGRQAEFDAIQNQRSVGAVNSGRRKCC